MKRMGVLAVMIGLAALSARAQTVTGSGTTGTIPEFKSSTTIGNSPIVDFNGNIGIGTTTPVWPLQIISTNTTGTTNYPSPITLWVESTAPNTGGAVWAWASSGTGQTIALNGENSSPEGIGVIGNFTSTNGQGGGGVIGQTNATSGFSYGARGDALGTTGTAVGVFGSTFSPDGWAAYFVNRAGGNIMVGNVNTVSGGPDVRVFRVDGRGTVFADGGFRPLGADFAEAMAVSGSADHYAPGDLLVIDATGERRLSKSQTPYSTLVAGIYSTQPGVVASQHRVDEALPKNEIPLAVVGIVPCKVTAENGPIAAGDLLVTSSSPGHAMKGTDRSRMLGAVVGKALEPLQKETGVIQVLVTLQ